MAHQTLVAIYDTSAQARSAADDLEAAGLSRSEINLHLNGTEVASSNGHGTAETTSTKETGGFMSWLLGKDRPEHEVKAYSERLDRGGSALSVRVVAAEADNVMAIIERHNPSDIDRDDDRSAGSSSSTGESRRTDTDRDVALGTGTAKTTDSTMATSGQSGAGSGRGIAAKAKNAALGTTPGVAEQASSAKQNPLV